MSYHDVKYNAKCGQLILGKSVKIVSPDVRF